MKWTDSYIVEGTDPLVTIGRADRIDPKTGIRKVSPVYHERFTVDGRQVSRTLHTNNKREAIRRALQRQLGGETAIVPVPSDPEEVVEVVSIGDGLDEYMSVCRSRDLARRTILTYELVIRQIKEMLGKRIARPVSSFSEKDFWTYNQMMLDGGLSPKTRYVRLVTVKQAFKYVHQAGYIEKNPLAPIRMHKPESKQQPCFSVEQVQELLKQADEHTRPIFALMAYTGLRFGEVAELRWADLLLDQGDCGFIRVMRGGSHGLPKNKTSRLVPVHPDLKKVLVEMPRKGERVFYDRILMKPLSQKKLLREIKALCERCGFENSQQYKLHSFRHFFCSWAARQNLSYKYVLGWLGHSDSRIVDLYFTMFDDASHAAMSSLRIDAKQSESKGSR
ncbi:site-specific integrase [Phycisphaeraceae bacterium D3-23]